MTSEIRLRLQGLAANDIYRTIEDIPPGQTVTKAWLTIKDAKADLDAGALLQLEITAVATAAGQIVEPGVGGTTFAELLFQVSESDTTEANIPWNTWHHYDIKVLTSAGKPYPVEKGRLMVETPITRATS
jgi:hypothetical protein